MNILKILSITLLLFSDVVNGQKTELHGCWQLTEVKVGTEIHSNLKAVFVFEKGGVLKSARSAEDNLMDVGTWKYNRTDKVLAMSSSIDKDFNGEATVKQINDHELVYNKDGATLYFKRIALQEKSPEKMSASLVMQKLDFTMADFFDDNEEYKYFDDEEKLPWNNPQEMIQSLKSVKQLVYTYTKINEGDDAPGSKTLTADVKANPDIPSLSIDFIFYGYDRYNLPEDTDLPPNNEYTNLLYPEKENAFRLAGNEQITTPAGTFDCTIIEVAGEHEECRKLWMITNKPGVYAKIIVAKPGDWGYYAVYELQDIKYILNE